MSLCYDFLAIVLQSTILLGLVQADCWFPDGTADTDGFPCNSTVGAVTHCCRGHEACMEKGVCYTQWDSQFYRRSCTDQNWGEGCPTICTDVDRSAPNGILACSQGTDPTYCCGNGSLTCCSPSQEFAFIPGNFLGGLDGQGNLYPPEPASTTVTRTATTTGGSQTTSSASSSTESSSSSSAAAASQTTSPTSSSESSRSRTIGLTVGIPLGVLLVGSIAGLFWFFNRKLNQEKEERRKLEEKLTRGNNSSKQELEGKQGWKKGTDSGQPRMEMESSGGRYEMPDANRMAYEVGTNTTGSTR